MTDRVAAMVEVGVEGVVVAVEVETEIETEEGLGVAAGGAEVAGI